MEKKTLVLQPDYMKNFKCIGNECPDNCCHGWNVTVDKKIYKKYRKIKNKDLKKIINKNITLNKDSNDSELYAKIVLDKNNKCPFLDLKGLCEIHKEFGEEYLSKTCNQYPRSINIIDNVLEISGSVSCPPMAELILLNKEQMTFDQLEKVVDVSKSMINVILDTNSDNEIFKYFWNLREVSIDILQNRNFEVWQRLLILGLILDKVQNAVDNGEEETIPSVIEQSIEKYCNENIKEMLSKIEFKENIQLDFINAICSIGIEEEVSIENYKKLYTKFLEGISFNEKDDKAIIESYKKGFKEIYEPFIKNNEYILENYLVNDVFSRAFPIKRGKNIFEEYCILVLKFALIKLFLIGIGNYNKGLNYDEVINTLYLYSRNIEHSIKFLNNILEQIKEENRLNMAFMSVLIKN
ncbi:flagellin lysine-N-methylase [Clostridium ganghwense]|uniref:Flagellin lysine-N-methylase n=1 Tax=Clostridium ganghwense TaxID=312089 RepID=A0ABT4CQY5_9CLOT|nr:flagellin lysine-N-methylase [Clostridium ganghwense]MCY6370409.1 flagellin lysine-N-methylase [Clostridium ganghwense]